MPYCPNCTAEHPKGTDNCPQCGAELVEGRAPGLPEWLRTYIRVWLPIAALVILACLGVVHGAIFAFGLSALQDGPNLRWLSVLALPLLTAFGPGYMSGPWLRLPGIIAGWLVFGCFSLWFYLPHLAEHHSTPLGLSPFAIPVILALLWPSIGAVATACGVRYSREGRRSYLLVPLAWALVVLTYTFWLLPG